MFGYGVYQLVAHHAVQISGFFMFGLQEKLGQRSECLQTIKIVRVDHRKWGIHYFFTAQDCVGSAPGFSPAIRYSIAFWEIVQILVHIEYFTMFPNGLVDSFPEIMLTFAVDDKDRDGLLTLGYEAYGIPSADISISDDDSVVVATDIVTTLVDTSHVSLFSVKSLSDRAVEIYFDRPVVTSTLQLQVPEPEPLEIIKLFRGDRDNRRILIMTAPQKKDLNYTLRINRVTDRWGNGFMKPAQ